MTNKQNRFINNGIDIRFFYVLSDINELISDFIQNSTHSASL